MWLYGGEDIVGKLICVIGKIWDGDELPKDWRTGIIVPLFKKGDPNEAKNYRGITLLSTAYKIYTEVIRKRLEKEVEEKMLLPEGQAGFRKGRSTLDNIFILNHIVQRAKRKNKKVYTMFVDLKAAFDTVDRETLWKILKNMGISEYLIQKLKGLHEENKVRIRMDSKVTREFWVTKGLRQGCVLSPILFCLYIAGLEEAFKNRNVGGIVIGKERV